MKISIIGLGKLGSSIAASFAFKGYDVIGMDTDAGRIEDMNRGKPPVPEPQIEKLLSESKGKLRCTSEYSDIIDGSDISFIVVPTPSMDNGSFSTAYIEKALQDLSSALKTSGKKNHVFVITSTVSPGQVNDTYIPFIEKLTGRKVNEGFEIAYNPVFIALGTVIRDFLNPDLILIGENNPATGKKIEDLYHDVCEGSPRIARMSFISAEIAKLSLNCFITMKISFANSLARVCEKVPGSDVDSITKAIGIDKRVSSYYLKAGMGFGGPCFPRDNNAFIEFAERFGCNAELSRATQEINNSQTDRIVSKVLGASAMDGNTTVSVLGMSYKSCSPVIEESPSVYIVDALLERGIRVTVFDRWATEAIRERYGERVLYAESMKDCIDKSKICIVATIEEEHKLIDGGMMSDGPKTIIDCWRILDSTKLGGNIKYIPLGRHEDEGL